MIKYYLASLSLVLLLFNSCASSSGISEKSKSKDKQQIIKIKEGALLVRLYVLNPKIQALQKLSSNPELSEDKRAVAQKQLNELREERQSYVEEVIKAFTENYDYSAVYFIADSLYKKFNSGQQTSVFYDPLTFKVDPNSKFDHSDYIIYATGKPDYKYSLLYPDLQIMTRPKRYYGIFAGSFVSKILPFVNNEQEARIKSIQKLNESFHKVWIEAH
jgi:hypothetical protein